jgi:ABC-type branched-subunit amino acid transport system ATPase component
MLLEVSGLEAGYGKLTVLHGVDLQADAGEVVSILGPNGAGKSTLMKAIAGHLPVKSGRVDLGGERIDGRGAYHIARSGVGYVPQDNNVFGDMSVLENLEVGALGLGRDPSDSVDAVFDRFPILGERKHQRASTLSGGERQALAVSSALIAGSGLLLLDETTAGLAPRPVEQIVRWIVEVAAQGTAVIWVLEQSPEPVLEISKRTYLMDAGLIRDEMQSSELLEPGRLEEVILEDRPTA